MGLFSKKRKKKDIRFCRTSSLCLASLNLKHRSWSQVTMLKCCWVMEQTCSDRSPAPVYKANCTTWYLLRKREPVFMSSLPSVGPVRRRRARPSTCLSRSGSRPTGYPSHPPPGENAGQDGRPNSQLQSVWEESVQLPQKEASCSLDQRWSLCFWVV